MNSTRIAIGTADGASVCDHLARSSSFAVFEMEDGRAVSRTLRDRSSNKCGNHASFVEILEGCQAVICGGIGQGAYDSLVANGIAPIVLAAGMSIDAAVAGYLAGTLVATTERNCLCH
jgi:predicted Fe-Mo cluster-binding NifX family protein